MQGKSIIAPEGLSGETFGTGLNPSRHIVEWGFWK